MKLSRWFMDSASVLAHHHEALANHDRVASISDKILSVGPYNEDALGMALSAHAETGNIGAAEHRYRTHRDLIQTELGEPPSPKMERLFQSLLSARSFSRTGTAFPILFSTPVAPFYDRRT